MKLAVYVNYRGSCEEAFRFYEEHLGATSDGVIRRHGDMPNPNVPAEWADKVLHARLELGSTILMGADVPRAEPMRSSYLTLFLDTEGEAERVYSVLAEGGEVFMELQRTPFANRFAMLRDRFGASWMLLHQPPPR
jgi:PhnB protein